MLLPATDDVHLWFPWGFHLNIYTGLIIKWNGSSLVTGV